MNISPSRLLRLSLAAFLFGLAVGLPISIRWIIEASPRPTMPQQQQQLTSPLPSSTHVLNKTDDTPRRGGKRKAKGKRKK
ncbi:MAG TPA: hypothetical protein VF666_19175 [Pyrinomonadaceae bacterium]|jgi:hypothetical protein